MPHALSNNSQNLSDNKIEITNGSYHFVAAEWNESEEASPKITRCNKKLQSTEVVNDTAIYGGIDFATKILVAKSGRPAIAVAVANELFRSPLLASTTESTSSEHATYTKYTPLVLAEKSSPTSCDPKLWNYATNIDVPLFYETSNRNYQSHQVAAASAFTEAHNHNQIPAFIRFEKADDETDDEILSMPEETIREKIAELPGFQEGDQEYLETLAVCLKLCIATNWEPQNYGLTTECQPGRYSLLPKSRKKIDELIANRQKQIEKKRKNKHQDTCPMPSSSGTTVSAGSQEPSKKRVNARLFR